MKQTVFLSCHYAMLRYVVLCFYKIILDFSILLTIICTKISTIHDILYGGFCCLITKTLPTKKKKKKSMH